jgi:hypothetical protein
MPPHARATRALRAPCMRLSHTHTRTLILKANWKEDSGWLSMGSMTRAPGAMLLYCSMPRTCFFTPFTIASLSCARGTARGTRA